MRGFGHVGFLVEDLDAACAYLEEQGVAFKKKPAEGNMRGANSSFSLYNTIFSHFEVATQLLFVSGLAFAYDPDGYWVEIIQRGGISMLDV